VYYLFISHIFHCNAFTQTIKARQSIHVKTLKIGMPLVNDL
jgi:hypothetical protein